MRIREIFFYGMVSECSDLGEERSKENVALTLTQNRKRSLDLDSYQ